jgi:amino acid adenylation domain-containing protein
MSVDTFVFPTSFAQRRLWFVHQLEPESPSYNVTTALWLSGKLDVSALERSLAAIVARHEALRTTFRLADDEPVQVVAPELGVELPLVDRSAIPAADRELEVRRMVQEEVRRPFDLERGPLLRARLIRLAPEEHALILVVHHIVFDGWSAGVLSRELGECYQAFVTGGSPRLPELPVQYPDYAVWQREWLSGDALERQLAYWRTQLAGAPALLELPTDHPRPRTQSHRGAVEKRLFSRQLTDGLTALSQEEGSTLFMTLLAGFQLLLSRYSGQEDIIVGSPIANRTRSELEHLIGFFVNSLALRTDLSGDPSFRELLRRVRGVALGAYAHQDLPFERLVEELQPDRIQDRNPFFQVMFALQNAPRSALRLPGIELRSLPRSTATSKFDLTLHMHQASQGLTARLEYNTDLFEPGTIARMLGHLERLLEEAVANPDSRLSTIGLLTGDQRREVLVEWNRTDRALPADPCVHRLFERQAAQRPDAVAVEAGSERLTYGELNRRANRVARYLRRRGVGPEARVGVALDRSIDLVVALLAVLKVGGAYVPLDPSHPVERLRLMLEDAGASVLLTGAGALPEMSSTPSVVGLSDDRTAIEAESEDNLEHRTAGEQLAYVMYTSGSTGRPKGIAIPHRAIVRLVCNTDYVQLNVADRVAQVSNTSFDAATFELWGALLNGARLVVISRDVTLSPRDFAAEIRARGISAMFLTTSLFNQLVSEVPEAFQSVRHLLVGGEAADPRAVRAALAKGPPERLLNVYGPTEATTFATWQLVREVADEALTVPIGMPIANTRAHVLDRHLEPVPPGIPGELYLGGPGLARGYLGRPGLTAERFVPDPFGAESGGRLYRTGDRVRRRAGGALEFMGRIDGQIKLRGFRIEPGEIESALAQHTAVRDCAVVLREDVLGRRELVAYVVPRVTSTNGSTDSAGNAVRDDEVSASEFRLHLQARLPEYMIPSAFVMLEALPLTPNGKLNRHALPSPEGSRTGADIPFLPPSNPVEETLAAQWREVLGIQRVGLRDNFFELGGHSLLAVKLFAGIERSFARKLPLSTLFRAPTLGQLADVLSQAPGGDLGSGLTLLRPGGGSRPPLYVVHLHYGDVMEYRDLVSRLPPDLTVYGCETPVDDQSGPALPTIEELASSHVGRIRKHQPTGPYFLCALCWAGPVAFEMACQLRAAGEVVGLLALIDSPYPGPDRTRPIHRRARGRVRKLWKLTAKNLRRLRALEARAVPEFLRQRLVNIVMRVAGVAAFRWSVRFRRPLLPAFRDRPKALLHARWAYRPRPYPDRITLFRAARNGTRDGSDPIAAWSQVAGGGTEVYEVPGDHVSMMREPDVQSLAVQLSACLERAFAQTAR